MCEVLRRCDRETMCCPAFEQYLAYLIMSDRDNHMTLALRPFASGFGVCFGFGLGAESRLVGFPLALYLP